MRVTKITLQTIALSAALFVSCSDDDDKEIAKIVSDSTGIDITDLTVPTSYTFTRNNETTVSFSGQTTRLEQVNVIGAGLTSTTSTFENLSNENFKNGSGFENESLNGSKKVFNKVANSLGLFNNGIANGSDAIKATFDGFISGYINEVQPQVINEVTASAGVAGIVVDGTKKRLVNAKGLEYNQAFFKSLIGGLVIDQVGNHYTNRLDEDKFDESNSFRTANDAETVAEGKNYTTMEHHWDEAYGYVYALAADEDKLLQNYINVVEQDADFKGIAQTISDAFTIGRAAIVAKKYEVRNEAIEVIRENIAKVVAIRAVYYLQDGKSKLAVDRSSSFHALSEAYGFINSLKFTSLDGVTPLFSNAEVGTFIATLEKANGFWEVTSTDLDQISDDIAAKFDFTVAQAAN